MKGVLLKIAIIFLLLYAIQVNYARFMVGN